MRPGGGKHKGSRFERAVCEHLSLWITHGKKKDCFWRSSMSGGRATIIHRKGGSNRQAGDITAVAPEGHALTDEYFIENKHVRDLAIASFIIKGTGLLATFWRKACAEARKHNRRPMLIAKQNNMPTIVLVSATNFGASLNPLKPSLARTNEWRMYSFDSLFKIRRGE